MLGWREFEGIWQKSIDVLEYQSPEVFRQALVGSGWRAAIKFVLNGAIISSLIKTVDGLINGADPIRTFVVSVLSAPLGFALFTLGVFWAMRLFGQKIRLRDLSYGFALFVVPLGILAAIATAFASLLPTLFGLLLNGVIIVVSAWLTVRLAYTAMQALGQFQQSWRVWLVLIIGALLGSILSSFNFDANIHTDAEGN